MTYTVREIFKTIQGEGAHTGRAAVFCRFSGCNLWSGREVDRAVAACKFCDTDFVGGTKYKTATALADAIQTAWNGADYNARFVVLTGGEPALQYDGELHRALKARSFYISIETNGTVPIRAPVDWKCVSPKAGTAILHNTAHELKFVYPQEMTPDEALKVVSADYQTLMPMDGLNLRENTAAAAQYVMDHPCWRLGHQLHKTIGLP